MCPCTGNLSIVECPSRSSIILFGKFQINAAFGTNFQSAVIFPKKTRDGTSKIIFVYLKVSCPNWLNTAVRRENVMFWIVYVCSIGISASKSLLMSSIRYTRFSLSFRNIF